MNRVAKYERNWLSRACFEIHGTRLQEKVLQALKENIKISAVQGKINSRVFFTVLAKLKGLSDHTHNRVANFKLFQTKRRLRKIFLSLKSNVVYQRRQKALLDKSNGFRNRKITAFGFKTLL